MNKTLASFLLKLLSYRGIKLWFGPRIKNIKIKKYIKFPFFKLIILKINNTNNKQ